MAIKVFEPQLGEASPAVAMVILNHAGSTVSQDTGRDAQAYADGLGIAVVAADRPGSGGLWPDSVQAVRQATPPGYVHEMAKLGRYIDRALDKLGVESSIVAGRSAGGLGALALTRTEVISSQHFVFAAEPVGCENMPVMAGQRQYQTYLKTQKNLHKTIDSIVRPDNGKLPPMRAASRLLSIVPAFYHDKYHNKQIWASDAAVQYAQAIACHQPEIDMTIEFAEHSLVIEPASLFEKFVRLEFVREGVTVSRSTSTTHASYDDHGFMIRQLSPVVERATRTW